ncbi:MAG: hypothetical protein ACJ78Q_13430 [Chloroflexia bacterium]
MSTNISTARGRERENTPALLWGATWRGSVWLTCAGAGLGAGFGLLITLIEALAGQWAGALLFGILAFLVGGLVGTVLGLVIGAIDGLLIGFVTRSYYSSLANWAIYRRDARILSAAICPLLACIPLALSGYLTSSSLIWGAIFLLAVGTGGWWTGNRLADWYIEEHVSPPEWNP